MRKLVVVLLFVVLVSGLPGKVWALQGDDITLVLEAKRHPSDPYAVIVYGSYKWNTCHSAGVAGSEDLIGIGWDDPSLEFDEAGTGNTKGLTVREINSKAQVVLFNVPDPLLGDRSCREPLSGAVFVVLRVPDQARGKTLNFTMQFDHTYVVKEETGETYSVEVGFEGPLLKGGMGYGVSVGTSQKRATVSTSGKLKWQPNLDPIAEFAVGRREIRFYGQSYPVDVAPFISNNRTYVPVRYLAYALGMDESDVSYDPRSQTVELRRRPAVSRIVERVSGRAEAHLVEKLFGGRRTVRLTVSSPILTIDHEKQEMDVSPLLINGRVFLPARFVAEAFGYRASWVEGAQTVVIYGR